MISYEHTEIFLKVVCIQFKTLKLFRFFPKKNVLIYYKLFLWFQPVKHVYQFQIDDVFKKPSV